MGNPAAGQFFISGHIMMHRDGEVNQLSASLIAENMNHNDHNVFAFKGLCLMKLSEPQNL